MRGGGARLLAWALIAVAASGATAGCRRPDAPRSLGRRVAGGEGLGLRASADGSHLAFLAGCRRVEDRTLPAGTAACDLSVVPADGGQVTRIASGVSSLGAGFGWSRQGHVLAALGRYDHVTGQGELVSWSGGAPRSLGHEVTFFAIAPDGGRVGWISGGRLHLAAEPGGAPAEVAGADRLATFAFAPAAARGVELLARRSERAGGALLAVDGLAAAPVAAQVRDYGFGPSGARFAFTSGAAQALSVVGAPVPARTRAPAELGREVQEFLFAPAGEHLAFVADAAPGRQGDLWVALPGDGPPVRLGRRVGEPRWARGGSRLAWLQDYDPRSRTGALVVGGPAAPPRVVAANVSDFDLTDDGGAVAYLVHETAGGYSVDLGLEGPGGGAAARIARGVFGFSFSPDGRWLYYRSACIREAEACDLYRVPIRPGGGPPERLVEGVKSFEFAPGRPERLLVTWSRRDRVALDVGVWEAGKLSAVDTVALPGSVQFLGADPSRVAYLVVDPKRAGVYVATLP